MLYLVIEEGSGEAGVLTLANHDEHAISEARAVLGYTDKDTVDLRAVSKHNASEPTRSLLAFWDAVAAEALHRGHAAKSVEDELRALRVLFTAACGVHHQSVVRSVVAERRRLMSIISDKRREAVAEREQFNLEDPGYGQADAALKVLAEMSDALRLG